MKISDPGNIGNLTIKNRIVMAPMISNLANPDGSTNENHIAYLTARARGGAGLIITEYTYIDSINARGSRNQMGAYTTSFVPTFSIIPETASITIWGKVSLFSKEPPYLSFLVLRDGDMYSCTK